MADFVEARRRKRERARKLAAEQPWREWVQARYSEAVGGIPAAGEVLDSSGRAVRDGLLTMDGLPPENELHLEAERNAHMPVGALPSTVGELRQRWPWEGAPPAGFGAPPGVDLAEIEPAEAERQLAAMRGGRAAVRRKAVPRAGVASVVPPARPPTVEAQLAAMRGAGGAEGLGVWSGPAEPAEPAGAYGVAQGVSPGQAATLNAIREATEAARPAESAGGGVGPSASEMRAAALEADLRRMVQSGLPRYGDPQARTMVGMAPGPYQFGSAPPIGTGGLEQMSPQERLSMLESRATPETVDAQLAMMLGRPQNVDPMADVPGSLQNNMRRRFASLPEAAAPVEAPPVLSGEDLDKALAAMRAHAQAQAEEAGVDLDGRSISGYGLIGSRSVKRLAWACQWRSCWRRTGNGTWRIGKPARRRDGMRS